MNWKNKITAEFVISIVFTIMSAFANNEANQNYLLTTAMIFLAAHGIIIEVRKSNDYKQTT